MKIKNTILNKKGLTLMEIVITVCVLAILLTAVFLGMASFAKSAYFTRANDTAKSIFVALQSSLTQAKVDGTLQEMFDPETSKYFKKNSNGEFLDENDNVITDKKNIYNAYNNYAFLPNDNSKPYIKTVVPNMPEEFDTSQYVYMAMDKNNNKDSKLLYDLIESKISDKEILQNSILVEINPVTAIVRSVFYTEKIEKDKKLEYAHFSDSNINMETCKYDVYNREHKPLKNKQQGYYGSNSAGYDEYIGKLDDPKIKIYNDDRLVIEWDEILATNFAENNPNLSDTQKEALAKNKNKVKYDLKIVNSDDTTKEYLNIKDISYYSNEGVAGGGNVANLDIYSSVGNYWLSEKNHNNALKLNTIENNVELGTNEETEKNHRLYYSKDNSSDEKGKYRLILDSLDVSISDVYKTIPWDENVKVIVDAKYMDVGFTSSMSITSDTTNPYFGMKIIEADENQTNGLNAIIKELFNNEPKKENIKYELSYSRHLNNIRYVISDNMPKTSFLALNADGTDVGTNANFKMVKNIDWSCLSLGKNINTKSNIIEEDYQNVVENLGNQDIIELINDKNEKANPKEYKLKILNTYDIATSNNEKVRGFIPLSTVKQSDIDSGLNPENKGYQGVFDGLFVDPQNINSTEIYSIYNLAIYNNYNITTQNIEPLKDKQTGLFDIIGEKGEIQNVNIINTRVLSDNENKQELGIGAFAGKVQGKITNASLKVDEEYKINVDGITSEIKNPLSNIGGNVIEGNNNVGGITGILESSSPSNIIFNPSDKTKIGFILNALNGEVEIKGQIEGVKAGVTVKGENNIGGIVGRSNSGNLTNTLNTGIVTSKKDDKKAQNAGGILGIATGDTYISANTSFEYSNYGLVEAKYEATNSEDMQGGTGGIIGYSEGKNTKIIDAFNKGEIKGTDNTGGIVGLSNKTELIYSDNIIKKDNDVKSANVGLITGDRFNTGGIIGYIPEKSETVIVNGFNKGKVTGVGNTGGLVGRINNKKSTSDITTYTNAIKSHINSNTLYHNSGEISGSDSTGGVIGVTNGAIINMYNNGEIKGISNGNRVGGIVGTSNNLIKYESESNNENRFSNAGAVNAKGDLVGGVVGDFSSNQNLLNATNAGAVTGRTSVGGIVGSRPNSDKNIQIKYDNFILDKENKLINKGEITAMHDNAGGIIGDAINVSIINPFNGATVQSKLNAGGIAGKITETNISYDFDNVQAPESMIYTNASNVQTYNSIGGNKGGIVGLAEGKNEIVDVFNVGKVYQGENTGGIIGFASGEKDKYTTIKNQTKIAKKIIDNNLKNNSGDIGSIGDSNVGGIVGNGSYAKIYDVYNGSEDSKNIEGKINVGGIIGVFVYGELIYDNDLIIKPSKNNLNSDNLLYANNSSVISHNKSNSTGGIVGESKNSLIKNALNLGNVTNSFSSGNAGNNVGGIIGLAENTNLTYDKDKVVNVMINNNLYTNMGVVKGGAYNTGGIIGLAKTNPDIIDFKPETRFNDVYNGAEIIATNNTGGIVGQIENNNVIHDVTTNIIKKAIENDMGTNVGSITGYQNVGGIYGAVTGNGNFNSIDVFNHSKNNSSIKGNKNVGGIVGNANKFNLDFSSNSGSIFKSNQGIKELIKENRQYRYTNTMNINANIDNSEKDNFGGILGNGTNCEIKDVYNSGEITGSNQIGGILGNVSNTNLSYDTVVVYGETDTPAKPTPDNNEFERYTNIGKVKGSINLGGIAGNINNTNIKDTFNKANINGHENIGGLVGYSSNLSKTTYTLQVGQGNKNTYGKDNSPFDDEIVRENPYKTYMKPNIGMIGNTASKKVGGLIGSAVNNSTVEKAIEVQGEIIGEENVGGIVGYLQDSKVENISNSSLIKGKNNIGGIVGQSYTKKTDGTGHITSIKNVRNYSSIGGTAVNNIGGIVGLSSKDDGYGNSKLSNLIDTSQNFGSISGSKNIGGILGCSNGPSDTKISMSKNDVNISENLNLINNTLGGTSNNKIFGKENIGGISGNACIIVYSSNTGHVEGRINVGGISGTAYQIDVSYNTANVKGFESVGGVAGYLEHYNNGSHIKNSYNESQVVLGPNMIGGIAGTSAGLIHQSYNAATIDNNTDTSSGFMGGIVGWLKQTNNQNWQKQWVVQYSYNVGRIGAGAPSGSIIGKMQGEGANDELFNYVRVYNSYYIDDFATKYLEIYDDKDKIQLNYNVPAIGGVNLDSIQNYIGKYNQNDDYDYLSAKIPYKNMVEVYNYSKQTVDGLKITIQNGYGSELKDKLNKAGANFTFLDNEAKTKVPYYEYPILDLKSENNNAYKNGYDQKFETKTQIRNPYYINVWPTTSTPYLNIGTTEYEADDAIDIGDGDEIKFIKVEDEGVLKETDIVSKIKNKEKLTFNINLNMNTSGNADNTDVEYAPIYSINVYDGFSIGDYTYDNKFKVYDIGLKNPTQKYMLARDSEDFSKPNKQSYINVDFGEDVKYIFYKSTANGNDIIESNIEKDISVEYNKDKKEFSFTLNSSEMDGYNAASSGYFTLEAQAIYNKDQIADKPIEVRDSDQFSRMFNVHFSNEHINEDYNDSIIKDIKEINSNTPQIIDTKTAALGSTKLDANNNILYENMLEITNERHLNNLNKNRDGGVSGGKTSQDKTLALPYINKQSQLQKDIKLSINKETGFNNLILGRNNKVFSRFTGTLDGNGYSIKGINVNTSKYDGMDNQYIWSDDTIDVSTENYGLIYELSGGVVKNLKLEGNIKAGRTGGIAYSVSNGRNIANDSNYVTDANNPYSENLGYETTFEQGRDSKIYNTDVAINFEGQDIGGFVNKTVRRFNNSEEVSIINKLLKGENVTNDKNYKITEPVLTAFNNTFSGSIDRGQTYTLPVYASGFISLLHGKSIVNDIDEVREKSYYPTEVNIDNFRNNGEIKGYNASGVVGASYINLNDEDMTVKNTVIIKNSANNGEVLGTKTANGIANGYFRTDAYNEGLFNIGINGLDSLILPDKVYEKNTQVYNSVNNGLVYSSGVYDDKIKDYILQEGFASGIGVNVGTIENSGNNGTVESERVASGVTYSNINNKINVSKTFNTGLVKGKEKSSGIAVKERYSTEFNIKDSFNSGTVLVETNVSDDYAHRNSYAGGIMAWAGNSEISESYNIGTVAYIKDGKISYDNRNVGGIVGGAVDSETNIINSYNLSDNQVNVIPQIYSTVNGQYDTKKIYDNLLAGYKLRAVGDSIYSGNVTNLNYSEMINQLDYYNKFNGDTWKIGDIDNSMNIPQLFNETNNIVDKNLFYIYNNTSNNLNANPEKDNIIYVNNSIENLEKINEQTNGYQKNILENKLKYNIDVKQPKFDTNNLTSKEYVSSPTVDYDNTDKTYSVNIPNYDNNATYNITIYDGDAFSPNYTAIKVREYKISNGIVISDDKLSVSNLNENQYFDDINDLVNFSNGKLTISKQEGLNFYMPIKGYYTAVVTKDSGTVSDKQVKPTQEQTSQRFNIHFANTINSNNDTWSLGQSSNPYQINDQYGIVGMTTSGISKSSTKDRNYKVTENITIDIPFYSMFEFEGIIDGDNKEITYKSVNNNLGFIHKLKDGEVKNLNFNFADNNGKVTLKDNRGNPIDISYNPTTSQGYYEASNIGKYLEDTGYRANVGLVSNYVYNSKIINDNDIKAKINNVKINGKIKLGDRNKLLINDESLIARDHFELSDKKIKDKTYDFASVSSVTGQAYNQAKIINTYSNVDIKAVYNNLYDLSGIAGKLTKGSEIISSINNGNLTNNSEIQASNQAKKPDTIKKSVSNLSGVVMTMDENVSGQQKSNIIDKSFNSGTIIAEDNISSGLVGVYNNGKITNSYNSGYIIARREKDAGGTAGGLIGNLPKSDRLFGNADMNDKIENVYNSGVVRGMYQGGIVGNVLDDKFLNSEGKGTHTQLFKNVYMLKDENLYWKDKFILTDKNILGFGYQPSEYWSFAKTGQQLQYKNSNNQDTNLAKNTNNYIKTYTNMQDLSNISFDTAMWRVDKDANKNLPNQYPLPQLVVNGHNTPINNSNSTNINGILQDISQFSEYTGLASSKNKTDDISYIPYGYANQQDELFTDTIKIGLKEIDDISEYNVILTNGDFQSKGSLVGEQLEQAVKNKTVITIKRNYIDSGANMSVPVGPQYTKALKDDNDNGYYYEILSDEKGIYRAKFENSEIEGKDSLSIQINNDYLDTLTTNKKPYYSVAVMAKVKENDTEDNNEFKKFTPLFANQPISGSVVWTYGQNDNKYNINTQRNLYNMSKGNDAVEGITKSDLAYLSSHFQQNGNITIKDDKTYNNYSISNGGKQFNIKTNRSKLWENSIGDEDTPLTGSYDGKLNAEQYNIFDETTNLGIRYQKALFGNNNGTISNIDYKLVNNQPSISANSLLISKNNGNVENLKVSNKNAGQLEILLTGNNAEFGLIIGQNNKNDNNRYKLSNLSANNIKVTKSSGNTSIKNIGGIIGISNNSNADISNIDFGGRLNVSGLDSVGGIIGQVEGQGLVFSDNVNISHIGSDKIKNIGGVVGKLLNGSDIEFKDSNINVVNNESINTSDNKSNLGTLIGSSEGTTTINEDNKIKINNVNVNTNIKDNIALNSGGLIGNSKNTVVSVNNSSLNGAINSTNSNANSTFGGMIGNIDGGSLTLTGNNEITPTINTNAQNVGGIIGNSKNVNISIDGISVNGGNINPTNDNVNSTFGGMIGNIVDGKIDILNSEMTLSKAVLTQANEVNLLKAKYVGGLIGKSSTTNGSNKTPINIINNNITDGNSATNTYYGIGNSSINGIIGGLIGQVDNSLLNIENTANKLDSMTISGTAGGLIGLSNTSDINISDSDNIGRYFEPKSGAIVNDFGGLIGKVNGGNLTIENSNKQVQINSTIGISSEKTNIGGLIGISVNASLNIIDSNNKFTGKGIDDAVSGNYGGLIGVIEKGEITLNNSKTENPIRNQNIISNNTNIGGLIGKIDTVNKFDFINYDKLSFNLKVNNVKSVGGIIGYSKNTNVNLGNLELEGIIDANSEYIGGLIGRLDLVSKQSKLSNITNNISISNSSFNLTNTAPVGYTGGFIGSAATVDHQAYTSSITIENSVNNGDVFTNNQAIGGAIGASNIKDANITNFVNNGAINYNKASTSGDINVAGIIGRVSGGKTNISKSKNTGLIDINNTGSVLIKASNFKPIAAGIVAKVSRSELSINETYNSGKINVVDKDIISTAGGIIGIVENSSSGAISNNYNLGVINAKNISGLVHSVSTNSNIKFNYNYNAGLLNSYGGSSDGISITQNLKTDNQPNVKYNVSLKDSVKNSTSISNYPELELYQMQDINKFNNDTGWNIDGTVWKLDDSTNYTLAYLNGNIFTEFDKTNPNEEILDQYSYLQKSPEITEIIGDINGIDVTWLYNNNWQKATDSQNPLKGFKITAVVDEKEVIFNYDITTKKAEILGNMLSISKMNVVDNGNGNYTLKLSKDDVNKITNVINYGETKDVKFKVSAIRGNELTNDVYDRNYNGELSNKTVSLTGTNAETNATLDRLEIGYTENSSEKIVLEVGKNLDGTGSIVPNNYNFEILNIPYEIQNIKLKLYANNPSSIASVKLNGVDVRTLQKNLQVTGEYEIQIPYGKNVISLEIKSSNGQTSTNYTITTYRLDKSQLEKIIKQTENILQYKDYFDVDKISNLENALIKANQDLFDIKVSDSNQVTDLQIQTAETSIANAINEIKTVYDDVVQNGIIEFNNDSNAEKVISLLELSKEIFNNNKDNSNINSTPEWNNFKTAYENASKGLSSNGTDMPSLDNDINGLCQELLKSIISLNYKINNNLDFYKLNIQFEQAKQKKQEDYTSESWEKFVIIKNKSENIINNSNLTQQEIDNIFINLWIANNSLIAK